MTLKIAVVVFVRNEYPDFCTWLAWYLALGVDTIIVYDDHSTDGTWEAAIAASRAFDVRPFRTDISVQPFTARQREVYLGAVREFREEFDWIGFLDADEFLQLRDDLNLPSFLARFPDAAAVAISWCIYGSNSHLLKPEATTVEAFTRHALPQFEHNRSVKSFVRPRLVVDRWRDPHTFEIGDKPYVDPQGARMRWGGPGAIAHDPDWSTAKLMHFIPRSMEHFIERIRRRSDLRGVTNEYWNVFDKNDLEDREPLGRLPRVRKELFLIVGEVMRAFCQSLSASAEMGGNDQEAAVASRSEVVPHLVTTCFGTVLAVDRDKRLVHVDRDGLEAKGCLPVYGLRAAASAQLLYLVGPPQLAGPVQASHDPRISDVLSYRLQAAADREAVYLCRPGAQRFLTALPPDPSGINATSSDRWKPSQWEAFSLTPVGLPDEMRMVSEGIALIADSAAGIRSMTRAGVPPMICASAIQLLSDEQRNLLARMTGAPLPAWV